MADKRDGPFEGAALLGGIRGQPRVDTRAVAAAGLDRMSKLFKQNAASEQEYNEAELRLDRANAALKIEQEKLAANQARFELAEAELEQFLLRAPFDGQIGFMKRNELLALYRHTSLKISLDRPCSSDSVTVWMHFVLAWSGATFPTAI